VRTLSECRTSGLARGLPPIQSTHNVEDDVDASPTPDNHPHRPIQSWVKGTFRFHVTPLNKSAPELSPALKGFNSSVQPSQSRGKNLFVNRLVSTPPTRPVIILAACLGGEFCIRFREMNERLFLIRLMELECRLWKAFLVRVNNFFLCCAVRTFTDRRVN
jgi:hypothetical protein